MKSIYLIIFLSLIVKTISAQEISVKINGSPSKEAYLLSLEGEKASVVDSVKSLRGGVFSFKIDGDKYHSGLYRLSFGDNKSLDFVFDGDDVNLSTYANDILDSMKVVNPKSNELYYSFVKLNKKYKTKTELLQLVLARYPKDDEYYKLTKQRLQEIQNEYNEFVNVEAQKDSASFIARYIRSSQLPIIDTEIPAENQLAYLKAHALDNVNFNDSPLIYSDVFTNKSIEYLSYYRNPQFPKELLEKEFMKAVDTLLNKAKVNQFVYQQITEYLIDGFKKFGFDKILDYIVENYVIKDNLCLDVETEGMIQKRIEQAKLLKLGAIVPDIVLPDTSGKSIELDKINADKVLIVFYASWCPHCKELLPKLKKLYNSQNSKRFEVFAISLDSSRNEWINFVKDNCAGWLNVSDLKGWDGHASGDYFIYATPTMFLVDNNKKIIEKPISFEECKSLLK